MPAPVSTVIRSASATHRPDRCRATPSPSLAVSLSAVLATPMAGADSPITDPPAREVPCHPHPSTSSATHCPHRVRVSPWDDPVVDRRGHDPRSAYVEQFWLVRARPDGHVAAAPARRRLRPSAGRLRARRLRHRPRPRSQRLQGNRLAVRQGRASLRHVRRRPAAHRDVGGAPSAATHLASAISCACRRTCRRPTSSGRPRRSTSTRWPAPTRWRRRCSPPATTAACSSRSSSPSASRRPRPPRRASSCARPADPADLAQSVFGFRDGSRRDGSRSDQRGWLEADGQLGEQAGAEARRPLGAPATRRRRPSSARRCPGAPTARRRRTRTGTRRR